MDVTFTIAIAAFDPKILDGKPEQQIDAFQL